MFDLPPQKAFAGRSAARYLLIGLGVLVLAALVPGLSAYGIALYHQPWAYDEVETVGAGCFDPVAGTGWGVALRGPVMWRIRMKPGAGERAAWRAISYGDDDRSEDTWIRARACFASEAQVAAWRERLQEVRLARFWRNAGVLRRFPVDPETPALCSLWMRSAGGSYVQRWSQGEPPSDDVGRLHADLMGLGWPGGHVFDPPPHHAVWNVSTWPPHDCDGQTLPGYEDEQPVQ